MSYSTELRMKKSYIAKEPGYLVLSFVPCCFVELSFVPCCFVELIFAPCCFVSG